MGIISDNKVLKKPPICGDIVNAKSNFPVKMFTPLYTKNVGYTQLSGKKNDVAVMMEKYGNDLLRVDVNKLFEEHHVKDVLTVKKMFDAEIERKRIELRTMVSDKYKDILTASDAIATMKDMSQKILDGIQDIQDTCIRFTEAGRQGDVMDVEDKSIDLEERTIVMQIRLTMALNEQIWLGLDENDFSRAAQFYLLAQHVHTGLRLLKKDILEIAPLLKRIKSNLESLRSRILDSVKQNLETSELDVDQTSSNLNALMLLENQSSSELVNTFIGIRKNALKKVTTQSHSSVRHQLSAMVKCLTTTVLLLHDCFVSYKGTKNGLIWKQLEDIVNEDAPPTLSKMILPHTPLVVYIPDIIKHFRPKCSYVISEGWQSDLEKTIKDWLQFTSETVAAGLNEALKLVTSIKGLHIIREEALKISVPDEWETICAQINLPGNFNIWYYFFQDLITKRGLNLISQKVAENATFLQEEIVAVLNEASEVAEKTESDLRWYSWNEDADDISRTENVHAGLSMKTRGFSPNIIKLCERFDVKYLDILKDTSLYLYGKEYGSSLLGLNYSLKPSKSDKKFSDKDKLESHLTRECSKYAFRFTEFLINHINNSRNNHFVLKSLISARFVQALTVLCPNYKRCVCFGPTEEWDKICECFTNAGVTFWMNWVEDVTKETQEYSSQLFSNMDVIKVLSMFQKWDSIEIQEQTEERTFKSHIKVPYQLSLALQESLNRLSDYLSCVMPHTLPRQVHLQLLERNVEVLLRQYERLYEESLTQKQALQFLFDVKFLTVFCVPRENMKLVQKSQEICDKLRANVDPFDLDVFYGYLQNNVKQCTLQSQVILGCLLPNNGQLANLGMLEKNKEHEKEPSILPISVPASTSWFPLLPVTAPIQKTATTPSLQQKDPKSSPKARSSTKRVSDTATTVRSGAAALFGAMTTDWFSNK